MRVFISHSSKDKPAVEALAIALRARGVEAWLDKWMIAPGDDVVAKINAGLDEANAGLIVFSAHARESRWVEAEVSYLTWARIQEGKVLIPVIAGDDAYVPPLLRPLARRGIEEIDAIADALFSRRAAPPPVARDVARRREQVTVSLRRAGDAIDVRVVLGGEEYGGASHAALPHDLESARDGFLRGFRSGQRRGIAEAVQQSLDASLAHLGRLLREFCFPGASAEALAGLLEGCGVGTVAEICFESDDAELLGLPFEALRLADHRLLATLPQVVTLRRPIGVKAQDGAPLASPIKVLTAVGAPDEGKTGSVLLDYEQELQNILDAVEVAQKRENVEVRILEIGHPDVIASAMARDAYHVLHLSCHGNPGHLELENEDGEAVPVTAQQLVDALRRAGRRLPLVFLNACHGGVEKGQTASFAESLLRAGVPCVLAMQTAVSDYYATELAREFYEHLARREPPLASHALAEARKELEKERLQRVQRGRAPLEQTQPEYATAALFVAGEEAPLADFSLKKEPLRERPVYEVSGPVPQLRIDELIGRRRELRETLRTLRDPRRRHAGVVLTGIGGVGKSAVAGRVMQRLKEDGWKLAAHVGRFDLSAIAAAVGAALIESDREESRKRADSLTRADLDERVRFQLLCRALAEDSLLLVLDDFEQNLVTGGGAFHDATVAVLFEQLLRNASRGRLLITCRYPVPRAGEWLREVPVGALSDAETRKLIQRLPALRERSTREIVDALRVIGGHPRVLELLDALLHGGEGRLPHVTKKLKELLEKESIDVRGGAPEERLQQAVLLGMRDVLLEQLVALARERGDDAVLFQAAVSNLPVPVEGLAHMLGGGAADGGRIAATRAALARLAGLSLVVRLSDDVVWVHRWTAEGLARMSEPAAHAARCTAAGRYRMWRVEHETHDLGDAIEALRNFLVGRAFDEATDVAFACFDALRRFRQAVGIAALAGEVLESLPSDHARYAAVADEEAKAHLALGFTQRAVQRYEELLRAQKARAEAEPDRADYQRDLSVLYNRIGDVYRALGEGEKAREAYLKDLAIAERLAEAEPERADYQRDLSVAYNKIGDVYGALGEGEKAREAYLKALAIAERLAEVEPDRADYQRDLSVSYNKIGDVYRALGEGEKAREAYLKSLAIRERLAEAEPDRADYQRDLSVSYNKIGDVYGALGEGEKAREAYLKSLAIFERLAEAEPERADYQRDLSVSYERIGDVYRGLGEAEKAREAYLKSLAIRERLAEAEPDRADYQRDLSVSYNKIGDVYGALGEGEKAREAYLKDLAIAERLAEAEPDRADYQRDLSVSYNKIGDVYRALGEGEKAREAYLKALAIAERLAEVEPDRADYQRDLSVSYERIGVLSMALGDESRAREFYLKDLAIAERLAEAEPDRADYQVDLATSLRLVGLLGASPSRPLLERALAILQRLHVEGRLSPQEQPNIADLEKRLGEIE